MRYIVIHNYFLILLCWSVALNSGCKHARSLDLNKVVVLPLDGIGVNAKRVQELHKYMANHIKETSSVSVVQSSLVDGLYTQMPSCIAEAQEAKLQCGLQIGKHFQASHSVMGAVGGLGQTYVVQLKALDITKGAITRSLEETLFSRNSDLTVEMNQFTDRLLELNRERPWYTRWWVWTLIAAGTGAAITVPLVILRNHDPYENVTLP